MEKKCFEKFNPEERLKTFNDFYVLTYDEQTQFLATSVKEFVKLDALNVKTIAGDHLVVNIC